jgi:hypothetical protein
VRDRSAPRRRPPSATRGCPSRARSRNAPPTAPRPSSPGGAPLTASATTRTPTTATASHGTYESAHDWWRDRYKVADDDLGLRPKVRDIRFHRLRANAAALVEWLRICYLAGWLGNPDRRTREATRKFKTRAERIAVRLAEMRYRMGVMGGYGENAQRLHLGQRTPPSQRPRGAPPGQTTLDIPDI